MEADSTNDDDDFDWDDGWEDDDGSLEGSNSDDENNADELANVVRPETVEKVYKALSADAQRAGGVLSRDDANRVFSKARSFDCRVH